MGPAVSRVRLSTNHSERLLITRWKMRFVRRAPAGISRRPRLSINHSERLLITRWTMRFVRRAPAQRSRLRIVVLSAAALVWWSVATSAARLGRAGMIQHLMSHDEVCYENGYTEAEVE